MSCEICGNNEADSLRLDTNRQYCFQLFKQQRNLLLCRSIVNTVMNFFDGAAETFFCVWSSVLVNCVFEQKINDLLDSVFTLSVPKLLCLLDFASHYYLFRNFVNI